MFIKNFIFWMLPSIVLVNAINVPKELRWKKKIELQRKGFQICGNQYEPKAINKRCCYNKGNSNFFYQDVSLCCNGEVHDTFKFNTTRICCNGEVINGDDFICCQNHKHDIPGEYTRQDVGCCGNEIMTKGQMCCRGSDFSTIQKYSKGIGCCNGKPFGKLTDWCQGTTIMKKKEEKCGTTIIDHQEQSCCNGVINNYPVYKRNNIVEKDENRACCGVRAYDSSKNTCCPDYKTIIPRDPVFRCCGTGHFNTTSEICCDKKVYTRQYGENSLCCGNRQMNGAEEGCCNDQIIYDKKTNQCCLGYSGGNVISQNSQCCNGQELTKDSLCCNSRKLIKKSNPSHNSCCLTQYGGESFNSNEKKCINGNLLTKRPDGKKLCGGNSYNPRNYICCMEKLIEILDGTKPACCFFDAIDENTQKCCNGYVINFPTDTGICCSAELSRGCLYDNESCSCTKKCNNKLYNPNSEICCGEKLYQKNDVKECCGTSPLYNNGIYTCCNGVRYNGSRECCGQRVLRDGETCCGDFVVQKISRRSQKCCVSIPYDPRFSDCKTQTGTVVSKPGKTYSPKCRLSKVYKKRNDMYGWIPAACNSKYGFLGTITNITSKWYDQTGRGYQTITLTGVRKLKGKTFKGTTLKFRIEYSKSKHCFSRPKRLKNIKVAIFTSAKFQNGYFDFTDHERNKNDVQYFSNVFFVTKVTRHFKQSFYDLKRSQICQFDNHYRYTSLIR